MRQLAVIDPRSRFFSVQFSFSNEKLVPEVLRRLPQETWIEHLQRTERAKRRPTGRSLLEPGEERISHVDLTDLSRQDLDQAGYRMIDAITKRRHHKDEKRGFFYMTRFIFVEQSFYFPRDEFKERRKQMYDALYWLTLEALWGLRAYINPLQLNGELIAGQQSISVNLDPRFPHGWVDENPVYVPYTYRLRLLPVTSNQQQIILVE